MKLFSKKTYQNKLIVIFAGLIFLVSSFTPQTVETKFWNWGTTDEPTDGVANAEFDNNEPLIEMELTMKEWVLKQVTDAGLNPVEAETIITCESRWNPDAMGINYNRTADLGLWQINSIHKDISNVDKLDYKKATAWAIQKRVKDGHWRAWACSRKLARR